MEQIDLNQAMAAINSLVGSPNDLIVGEDAKKVAEVFGVQVTPRTLAEYRKEFNNPDLGESEDEHTEFMSSNEIVAHICYKLNLVVPTRILGTGAELIEFCTILREHIEMLIQSQEKSA